MAPTKKERKVYCKFKTPLTTVLFAVPRSSIYATMAKTLGGEMVVDPKKMIGLRPGRAKNLLPRATANYQEGGSTRFFYNPSLSSDGLAKKLVGQKVKTNKGTKTVNSVSFPQ